MDEAIYQIAEQIVQLHQKAYEVYLPLVEDVCSRIVSEDELSHLLEVFRKQAGANISLIVCFSSKDLAGIREPIEVLAVSQKRIAVPLL